MKLTKRCLSDVADLTLGKMLDDKKNRGDPLPYLANINVRWGEFDLGDLREMRFQESEKAHFGLRAGDIVMCEGGEPGRCAIWKEEIPGMMFQKALHRIRPHAALDNRFLFYTFLQKGKQSGFTGLFTGSTIKHLPAEKLAKLEIEFPELPTQRRIADILTAYDDLMENNRRRMALLEESARQLYREWFVRLRYPGHERACLKAGLPTGWAQKKLGDVLTLKRGYDLSSANRSEGEIPIVSSSGITGFHSEKKADAPGVVTGRYGTLGEVYFIDQNYWPLNTALYVSDFKGHPALYVLHLLKHELQNVQSDKAAIPGLNRNVVHDRTITYPPESLRDRFSEIAEPIYRQLSVLALQNQKLRAARDHLLPRLLSGALAV